MQLGESPTLWVHRAVDQVVCQGSGNEKCCKPVPGEAQFNCTVLTVSVEAFLLPVIAK